MSEAIQRRMEEAAKAKEAGFPEITKEAACIMDRLVPYQYNGDYLGQHKQNSITSSIYNSDKPDMQAGSGGGDLAPVLMRVARGRRAKARRILRLSGDRLKWNEFGEIYNAYNRLVRGSNIVALLNGAAGPKVGPLGEGHYDFYFLLFTLGWMANAFEHKRASSIIRNLARQMKQAPMKYIPPEENKGAANVPWMSVEATAPAIRYN